MFPASGVEDTFIHLEHILPRAQDVFPELFRDLASRLPAICIGIPTYEDTNRHQQHKPLICCNTTSSHVWNARLYTISSED